MPNQQELSIITKTHKKNAWNKCSSMVQQNVQIQAIKNKLHPNYI